MRALFLALLAAGLAPQAWGSQEPEDPPPQPNIVLILCDDMGWSDIGCYGGEVRTPNIDRLAAEGLRFTQFYNNAKCTTTRASVLTGLYPRRGKGGLLRRNMVTLGEVLGAAGYGTVLSGKWHLGRTPDTHPSRRGFDDFYGLLDGCCNFFDPARPDPPYKGGRTRYFATGEERITEFPDDYYTTDAFTDHALKSLDGLVAEKRPFFLHVCYTAPHYPLHARPADIAKYRGKYLLGWDALRRRRYDRQVELGLLDPETCRLSDGDSRAYAWETADKDFEDLRMAVYAAMIDRMDQNIGRLLQRLDELGVAENTIVLFLSDNGGCAEEPGGRDPEQRVPGGVEDYVAVGPAWGWAQNAPFRRYKSWVHEGGISTPLVVRWPGRVAPGSLARGVGHVIDLMPTLCELAGTGYPATYGGHEILPAEGVSLLPVLEGEAPGKARLLGWEWSGNRALRQGRWKVVWDKQVKQWELYDLESNRSETEDLAGSQPARVEALMQEWYRWAAASGLKVERQK